MNEQELYLTDDNPEVDPMQRILYFNTRRSQRGPAPPVVLLQLSDTNQLQTHTADTSDVPYTQRRTTIVNTGSNTEIPYQWFLEETMPNMKATDTGRPMDEFSSARKSKVYADPRESVFVQPGLISKQGTDTANTTNKLNTNNEAGGIKVEETSTFKYKEDKIDEQDKRKINTDAKLNEMEVRIPKVFSAPISLKTKNNYDFILNNVEARKGNEDDLKKSVDSISTKVSLIAGKLTNFNKEITAFPAEFTYTDQESPFHRKSPNPESPSIRENPDQKESRSTRELSSKRPPSGRETSKQDSRRYKSRDERNRRPSSRVRVLLMVDEWDEEYDESKSPGQSYKKRRGDRGKPDGYGKQDKNRRRHGKTIGSEGSLLSSDEDDTVHRSRRGDDSGKPYSKSKRDNNRRKQGKTVDSQGSLLSSDEDDKVHRSRRGDDSEKPYSKSKRDKGRKPGEEDNVYGDGRHKKEGYVPQKGRNIDDSYQRTDRRRWPYDEGDGKQGKRGRPLKDRTGTEVGGDSDGDVSRKTNSSKRPKEKDKRAKDKPERGVGDGAYGSKYRTVYAPPSATMLNTRRRYHLQITDHSIKEPWFNARFNITSDNDVEYNYEGPVKITPYYVKDKFY